MELKLQTIFSQRCTIAVDKTKQFSEYIEKITNIFHFTKESTKIIYHGRIVDLSSTIEKIVENANKPITVIGTEINSIKEDDEEGKNEELIKKTLKIIPNSSSFDDNLRELGQIESNKDICIRCLIAASNNLEFAKYILTDGRVPELKNCVKDEYKTRNVIEEIKIKKEKIEFPGFNESFAIKSSIVPQGSVFFPPLPYKQLITSEDEKEANKSENEKKMIHEIVYESPEKLKTMISKYTENPEEVLKNPKKAFAAAGFLYHGEGKRIITAEHLPTTGTLTGSTFEYQFDKFDIEEVKRIAKELNVNAEFVVKIYDGCNKNRSKTITMIRNMPKELFV